jgi:hypothetical protein
MFGNWAVGSPDMETRPTMVIRIEMTIATIGRLMKNLDMAAYPLLAGAGVAGLSSALAGLAGGVALAAAGAAGAAGT